MILKGIDQGAVVPVVSLLVFQDQDEERVLLGVRKKSPTSPRHPDVLSTPTMRIPYAFMTALLSAEYRQQIGLVPPHFEALSSCSTWQIGVPYSLASPQAFVAEALMCRKLALGPLLIQGAMSGQVSQVALAYDRIHDDVGGYEDTLMLTMSCVLTSKPVDLPQESPSYTHIGWVDAQQIDAAVKSRDPLMLIPNASPFEVCIHGLCVRSAAFAITSR